MTVNKNIKAKAIVNTVGNTVYLFAQWFLTVLTTRFLGYESVGILTLAMSVGNVFTFIQYYGVRSFQSSDTSRQYTSGDYLRTRFATTGTGMILCLIFVLYSNYNRDISISIILFVLFRSFEAISDVYFGDFQREGRLELVGITMFIRGIITVVLFFAGLYVFHNLNMALIVIVLGSLAVTVLIDSTLYFRIVPREAGTLARMKGIIKACFPLLIATLLPTVITAYPRIVLERYYGAELLGYYGNVSTPAVIITAIVPNVLASVMPVYGEMVYGKKYSGVRRLWIKTILGTCLIMNACILGVWMFGKPVMAWIYTDAIIPYVHYLYFFLISTALYAVTMCNASVLTALRKIQTVSFCAVVATVVCMGLSVPLVRSYGIPGAIAVLILAYFVQIVLQVVVVLKNTNTKITAT